MIAEKPAPDEVGPENDADFSPRAPAETARSCWRLICRLPAELLVGMVRIYQWTLSPLVGRQCRFQPTCSHFFIGAVRKYGAMRGTLRGVGRILRCHPFHPGGYDPP